MANPPQQEKFLDFITPQLDYKRLQIALARVVKKLIPTNKENEFDGTLKYRVLGNKIVNPAFEEATTFTTTTIPFFDIRHAVADPFRDQDVENERLSSKGIVDRETIEKRNVLYVESKEMGQMLYLATNEEEPDNLATFLVRIVNRENNPVLLKQASKILFGFKDQEGMRDPFVIPSKEKDQKSNVASATKDLKADKKTSTECKGKCKDNQ